MQTRWPNALLLAGSVIGTFSSLWIIATGEPSSKEVLLLGVVLTISSMLGSWVASRFYAESSFNENLKLFALKAAEKVDNLSKELDRLSVFLQQELDSPDYANPAEKLLARELRMEGAIHIINTLKSVNDRSLSDWEGVIGKELDEKREQQQEREEELRGLLERVETLYASRLNDPTAQAVSTDMALRNEINAIRAELRVLTSQISGVPVRRPRPDSQTIEFPCPSCAKPVRFRQRPKPLSIKARTCTNCGARLYSRFEDTAFVLRLREPLREQITCPRCTESGQVAVDPVPGSALRLPCATCGAELNITRSAQGVSVRVLETRQQVAAPALGVELTDAILSQVEQAMPPQPWPKGAAKNAARALNLPLSIVSRAITELIRRRRFKPQLDGKLYEPIRTADE